VGKKLIGLTVLYCVVLAAFSTSSTLWVSLPLLFTAGLTGSVFMSANNALIQLRITDDIRGRVMGTYMLTWGLMPLGALPMGMIAEVGGIQIATATGALLAAGLTIVLALRNRELTAL
jgi:MFS family permease